jgi:hypothetical protein
MAIEKTKCLRCDCVCDIYNVLGGCRCQYCNFSFAVSGADNSSAYFLREWQIVPVGNLAVFSWEEL